MPKVIGNVEAPVADAPKNQEVIDPRESSNQILKFFQHEADLKQTQELPPKLPVPKVVGSVEAPVADTPKKNQDVIDPRESSNQIFEFSN